LKSALRHALHIEGLLSILHLLMHENLRLLLVLVVARGQLVWLNTTLGIEVVVHLAHSSKAIIIGDGLLRLLILD
jgi:hypothetical protein